MLEQIDTIWVTDPFAFENHYIGVGFSHLLPFPELIRLEAKEHNSKVKDSTVVLLAEEQEKLDAYYAAVGSFWGEYGRFKPLPVLPDKLWHFTMDPLPEEVIFTTRSSGIVMNAACAEVLRRFRLGKTQLVPLRMHDPGTGEAENDALYYFLGLCERRNFFIPEASDPRCKYIGYEIEGYRQYRTLFSSSKNKENAYVMKSEALNCDVDLWHEAMLMGSICFSDALRIALQEENMLAVWHAAPAKIMDQ